jgi:hypothetical protein
MGVISSTVSSSVSWLSLKGQSSEEGKACMGVASTGIASTCIASMGLASTCVENTAAAAACSQVRFCR